MRKRLISLLLSAVMLWLVMVPCLTGCSGGSAERYTIAQWLNKVENSFNMVYYTADEPLIQTIRSDHEYYDVIQIAAEWGLVSAEDGLDFDAPLTKELCADTLATATNFTTDVVFEGIGDADKITAKYADGVNLALSQGILTLDEKGYFEPAYKLTKSEADTALLIARDKWTNFSFGGECYDKSVVHDGVINLGGVNEDVCGVTESEFTVEYSGDTSLISPDGTYSDNSTKTITFAPGSAPVMETGTVLAMPGDNVVPMDYAVIVDSIVTNDDGSVTVYTHNAGTEAVYQDINIRYSGDVDLSEAVIITPNGEVLTAGDDSADMSSGVEKPESTRGLYVFSEHDSFAAGKNGFTKTFEVNDDLSVTVSFEGNQLNFELSAFDGAVTLNEAKSLSVEYDYDMPWFFDLKSFYLKLITDTTENLTLKYNYNDSIELVNAGAQEMSEEDLKAMYTQLAADLSAGNVSGQKLEEMCNAKLFDVVIPSTPIHFTVRLGVSVSGKLEFLIERSDIIGVEKVGKNIRFINDSSEDRTITFDGRMEAYLKVGLELIVIKSLADVGAKLGVGVAASSKVFLSNAATGAVEAEFALPRVIEGGGGVRDESGITAVGVSITSPEVEVCLEVKAYPVFSVYALSKGTVAAKIFGSMEQEFFGKDDPFATIHYENKGGFVDSCTKSTTTPNYDIETGSELTVNYNEYILSVGEESTGVKMITLPRGVKAEDVVISSSDTSVVTVENLLSSKNDTKPLLFRLGAANSMDDIISAFETKTIYYKKYSREDVEHFRFTGVSDGVATVTINAGGSKWTMNVVVGNGGIISVSEGRFVLKDTTINLTAGSSQKIVVEAVPEGYSMTDVVFSSTDTSVARVDAAGNVSAAGETGSAIIYVSTRDGMYTGACLVNVY